MRLEGQGPDAGSLECRAGCGLGLIEAACVLEGAGQAGGKMNLAAVRSINWKQGGNQLEAPAGTRQT